MSVQRCVAGELKRLGLAGVTASARMVVLAGARAYVSRSFQRLNASKRKGRG